MIRKDFFKQKNLFIIIGIVLALFCLSCFIFYSHPFTPPQAINTQKKRIVFVSPQTNYPIWLQAKKGFDDAAKEYGFYGIWAGGGNCNIDDMEREIKISIAEKNDAIITCPLTPAFFSECFSNAINSNIPIITIAVDAEQENLRTAFVGSDYETLGSIQAAALHEQSSDPMKIGVIMSGFDTQNQIIQVNQLEKLIANIPNAQIVARAEDWADPIVGISVFTKMLDEHPEINAVFVTSGGAVSNYGKILRDRKLETSVTLIGMDIIKENLDAVRAGNIYGVMSQDFYSMGYLAGKYAFKASQNKIIPAVTYTDSMLITKNNVDSITTVEYANE